MDDATTLPKAPIRKKSLAQLAQTALLVTLVLVLARTLVTPFEVDGASMMPTLHNRERVLVNRSVYFHFDLNRILSLVPGIELREERVVYPFHMPERGDVVVLNPPVPSRQPYIKRVIGLPGETITFQDGYVVIDGQVLDEPYLPGPITKCNAVPGCYTGVIPEGHVYVLGDNRDNSFDSRVFGPVKIDDVIGKAWFTNWPPSEIGFLPRYEYRSEAATLLPQNARP